MTGPVTPTVDGKVRSIVLKDIPAKDALKAVLYQMGLDYSVRPGFIWISRPDVLLSEMYVRLETRLYVLENADSMTEIEIVTILRNAMPEIVEPNTGRVLSYVSYDSRTKILILVNSSSNLDKGEQELEDRGFAPQRIATDAEHMIADSEASEPSVSSNTYDTPTP